MKNKNRQNNRNKKMEDGKFHSKHIKHNPQAESARDVFGLGQTNSKEIENFKNEQNIQNRH